MKQSYPEILDPNLRTNLTPCSLSVPVSIIFAMWFHGKCIISDFVVRHAKRLKTPEFGENVEKKALF